MCLILQNSANNDNERIKCILSYRIRADGGTCLLRETSVKFIKINTCISGFQKSCSTNKIQRGFQHLVLFKRRRNSVRLKFKQYKSKFYCFLDALKYFL